ncbi:alpha/beta hydrolase [Salinarimonas chemoclinalis]|uniref:alpha/beta hydrolase n=1 Tax=Salinarimonas chemoclinalis TaxID=3241599 RepID=UPI0035564AFC
MTDAPHDPTPYDPETEVAAYERIYDTAVNDEEALHDLPRFRQEYCALFRVFPNAVNPDVVTRDVVFETADGTRLVGRLFRPRDAMGALPCLIYAHGGGFISGELWVTDGIASDFAARLGMAVVTYEYRLAPEHPFPVPLLDSVAVIEEVFARARELEVDPDRIAFGGESCGGNFAVAAPMVLAAKGGPRLRGALPVNPVFDVHRWARREVTDVDPAFAEEMYVFTSGYLGPDFTFVDSAGASPLRAARIGPLPRTFAWAAQKDPLHLELVELAARIRAEGGEIDYALDPHAVHGSLRARRLFRFAAEAFERLCRGLAWTLDIAVEERGRPEVGVAAE